MAEPDSTEPTDPRLDDADPESVPADEREQHPATWENVVVGRAKEALGHAFHDDQLAEQGEDQAEVAHEVREETDQQS